MEIFNYTAHSLTDLLKTGIYKIYHKTFPERIYIGSASRVDVKRFKESGFLVRWKKHLTEVKNNKHKNLKIQRLINKYGLNDLVFEIIEYCNPEDCLIREKYYIDLYNAVEVGLNIRKDPNSNRGLKLSEEQKNKIRLANLNKFVSMETRKKISDSKKGIKLSEQQILKQRETSPSKINFYCYNKEGILEIVFNSGRECERHFNFKKGRLWGYIKNNSYIDKQFLVFREEKPLSEILEIVNFKKLKRTEHIAKANKARLSKKIPC